MVSAKSVCAPRASCFRRVRGWFEPMNALEENSKIAAAPASLQDLVPLLATAGSTPLERLQALRAQTATAKWEGNLRGAWPIEEYNELLDKESAMLMALAQLSSALQHLSGEWRVSLNRGTLVLNPEFVSFSFFFLWLKSPCRSICGLGDGLTEWNVC